MTRQSAAFKRKVLRVETEFLLPPFTFFDGQDRECERFLWWAAGKVSRGGTPAWPVAEEREW
jgi:hypothetical protein